MKIRFLLAAFLFTSALFGQDDDRIPAHFTDLGDPEQLQIYASWLVHAASVNDTATVRRCLAAGLPVDAQNKYGLTALNVAAQHGFVPLVDDLLKHGARPDIGDNNGRTALLEITAVPYDYRYNWSDRKAGRYPETVFHIARLLFAAKASPDVADREGNTALMQAADYGDSAMVALLLANHAKVNPVNDSGLTAFSFAANEGYRNITRQLLSGNISGRQKLAYLAWKFSRVSGLLALAVIVLVFFLARSARVGRMARAAVPKAPAGDALRLAPLQCQSCGAGLPLVKGQHTCPGCGTPFELPADYVATTALRERAATELQLAEKGWKRIRVVSAWPLRLSLVVLGMAWLFLTLLGHVHPIGRALYGYTHEEGWGGLYMSTKPHALIILSLLGGLVVAAAFWYFAAYLARARKLVPALPRIGKTSGEAETDNCPSCGGAVYFAPGQLSCGCGYCGTELFRPSVARAMRSVARSEQAATESSLQGAMLAVARLKKNTWEAVSRPLYGLLGLLAATGSWTLWDITHLDFLMGAGWVLLIPAMLYLAYAFTKAFPVGFWKLALLLVAGLAYFAWASLLAGMVGSFVGVLILLLLLPVQLIFLKAFQEK